MPLMSFLLIRREWVSPVVFTLFSLYSRSRILLYRDLRFVCILVYD